MRGPPVPGKQNMSALQGWPTLQLSMPAPDRGSAGAQWEDHTIRGAGPSTGARLYREEDPAGALEV